jgi:outer membrane biosynthesis protein TonB
LLCLFINTAYSQTSTTTVTVNGNTTTTVITNTTPTQIIPVPNSPNYGDITTNITNQVDTTTNIQTANKNTGNLFSGTNFCNGGWTGTQITNSPSGQTSDLGCDYLTGKGTSSYAENNLLLTDKGISKIEQNLGFTQSASAYTHHFWNWNTSLNFSHSVINNDTGATITQNRILEGNRSINNGDLGTKSLDNIIIGTNSASGFTSNMRFDFSTPQAGTWVGVDVSQPNLSISYTGLTSSLITTFENITTIQTCESLGTCYVPIELPAFLTPTSGGTITELISEEEIKEIFKEEFAKVGLTEADVGMSALDYKEMANEINTQAVADMKEANPTLFGSPEPTSSTAVSTKEEPTATVKEEPTTLTKQEPTTTSAATETTTSTATENTTAMTKEEPTTSTKESNATTSSDKETTSVSEKTNTNTDTKSEESKTTTSQSATNENQKAEGSQTEKVNEKAVSDKSVTTNEKGTVNVGVNSIEAKVKTAIERVEREVKSIDQKTRAIQEIKLEAIKTGAPNLSTYENRFIPDGKTMVGVPNLDFYNQINIYQEQIYKDVSLSAYITKDPIAVKQNLLSEIEDEKNSIILEIEMLTRNLKKG